MEEHGEAPVSNDWQEKYCELVGQWREKSWSRCEGVCGERGKVECSIRRIRCRHDERSKTFMSSQLVAAKRGRSGEVGLAADGLVVETGTALRRKRLILTGIRTLYERGLTDAMDRGEGVTEWKMK